MEDNKNKNIREFKLTTAALKNTNTVILVAILLAIIGFISYINLPKESFPEVEMPTVFVKTIYPGNAPIDMENLVTRPLEKELQSVDNLKTLRSTSSQDNSDIIVELVSGTNVKDALSDVKDKVDQAMSELPDDLITDPIVLELDFSEFPILNINLFGDFSVEEIRDYAELLEEEIEKIEQISKVEIKGLNDREILLNIDKNKLKSVGLSFNDIENAINSENLNISGGDLIVGGERRSIRTNGEFKNLSEIENLIVKHEKSNIVYLKDVLVNAKVVDGFADPLTFACLNNKSVVSLQVVKKSGENLLVATEEIMKVLDNARKNKLIPDNLEYTISNDQSEMVKKQVSNLENSIILGIIFVVTTLFFFLGTRNAIFVGTAIPMSMLISFVIISVLGYTINMMILFGLVLALGMLVDNAIVVVENSYRYMGKGLSMFESIRQSVGEIAWPIIASTATTLAAFTPLAFWPGMIGNFMKLLPITLIIVLSSSLFVALVIIPVLIKIFVNPNKENSHVKGKKRIILFSTLGFFMIMGYITGFNSLGTFSLIIIVITALNHLFFFKLSKIFQDRLLVWLEDFYLKVLNWSLKGIKPRLILIFTFLTLIVTIIFFSQSSSKLEFFPPNEPSFINVMVDIPVGSDIKVTNEFMYEIEAEIEDELKSDSIIVESILTSVGKGVVGQNEQAFGNTPEKGMTTISFIDYDERPDGTNTSLIMKRLADRLIGKYPGVKISIQKNAMGPPVGNAINLEIIGQDFDKLVSLTDDVVKYIRSYNIPGIEGLDVDVYSAKPELLIEVNREQARRYGLSTAQIGSAIRTSLFGKEISDYKVGEDEYPIRLRYAEEYRDNISDILNHKVVFRNNQGKMLSIPISSVASMKYSTTYDKVLRKDLDRVITISSNVLEGYNANEINEQLGLLMSDYDMPEGFTYKFTGEQEEMQDASSFLAKAMLIGLGIIIIILVTQFNSVAKPLIIMASVLFSTIGVFGGLATFGMNFIIIMTGVGIISLAGIVVNNAIVLIDYIDLLKDQEREKIGLEREDNLPLEVSRDCVIRAGKTRLRPVLLTAITTILGLLPMALGMNIDFAGLLNSFQPNIYFGGENADFWGPMAWTVIFGLSFATFLTLIVVPAMYLIGNKIKLYFVKATR